MTTSQATIMGIGRNPSDKVSRVGQDNTTGEIQGAHLASELEPFARYTPEK